jgi:beta-glucanase (GH16 family)
MLLDDEAGEHSRLAETHKRSPSPGKGYLSSKLVRILSAIFMVALVGGVGAVVKHLDSTPTAAPANPQILPKPTETANTPPPWASWPLKFNATFQGSQLDTHVWTTCYTWATNGCTNYGNAGEKEWYLASQDQVSGGELHLVAQQASTRGYSKSGASEEYACRSGIVTSSRGLNFEYGYIQITAEIPFGKGLWPALWLGGTNQKWPPEVDIFEHWNSQSYGKVYLHPLSGIRQGGAVTEPGLGTGWHTFSLYWTPTRLVWYYDGNPVFATSTGVPHQDMFLLMNVADDADGPGTCSGSMNIRSVKVWQQPS